MAVQKKKKPVSKAKATARSSRKPAKKSAAARKPAAKKSAAKKGTAAKKTTKKTDALNMTFQQRLKEAFPNAGSKNGSSDITFDDIMNMIIQDLGNTLEGFMETINMFNNLSPLERARLIGAGVRNYGFIEKVRDIAIDNPSYLPPNFDVAKFSAELESFDRVRQIYLLSEKFESISSDKMLLMSNDLYRESLRVYNTLKEQTKARVGGARDLFMALETYFRRRRISERPMTEKEEIKRAKALIKGTIDGEMKLKNIKAKKSGGVHEIVEDIHKDRIAGKESAEFDENK